MDRFNYLGLFKEIRYIFLSLVFSFISVLATIFVYNHSGEIGAIEFVVLCFLATRLLYLGVTKREDVPLDAGGFDRVKAEKSREGESVKNLNVRSDNQGFNSSNNRNERSNSQGGSTLNNNSNNSVKDNKPAGRVVEGDFPPREAGSGSNIGNNKANFKERDGLSNNNKGFGSQGNNQSNNQSNNQGNSNL